MSVKDLFEHGTSIVSLKSGSLTDSFKAVESYSNIQQIIEKQNRFIPPIDFSTTSNFAKFGSAELYYDTAIKRIYGNYPYDGTAQEKNKFDNQSLYIDKYIFDYLYPRSTGYAIFSAEGWGSRTGISTDGYATPTTLEYVQFRGGPHTSSYGMDGLRTSFSGSNVYDENIYDNIGLPSNFGKGSRTSNLKFTGSDGATVEFWLKKPSFDTTTTTRREVIFDLWNSQTASGHSGSTCYGRMMIELDGEYSTGSSFLVTLMSGTSGFQHRRIGSLAGTSSLADWNHYAFTFLQSGSYLKTKFYVNGGLNEEVDSEFVIGGFEHGQLQARIGALLTAPTGSAAPAASGKLSASLDDFRYWKAARTSREISEFYFVPVHGGTNTDVANATLGVYYKFNEGITGTSSTDSIVLDYSGRVSNGYWVGLNTSSRHTGSAIVQASASNSEFLDPIIHPNHTEVKVLSENLSKSGSLHDHLNNAMLYNTMPTWITDQADREGSEDLRYLCHILGAYFDKMYLQIESLSAFNNTQYLSASYKAFPFYKSALEGKGLEAPEMFIESDILEKFAQRTDSYNLNIDLTEIKNLIYQNIHSNLINIYKAKGTEKAIRNVMRSFGIGDDLIKMNLYANNATFELSDNIHNQFIKKKYVNFSKKGQSGGVVYQTAEAGNTDSFEFISGSKGNQYEKTLGFTLEANVMFPKYLRDQTDDFYDRNWLTSSLFGMHRADHTASSDVTTWSPSGSDYANFQIQFIRDYPRSRSGYFRISSSNSPYPIPEMTSSMFHEVYDDDNWLISFTMQPKRYRELSTVSGASHLDVQGYDAIFAGYHKVLGTTIDSFYLTQSMETTASRDFLKSDKRVYAGAYRDNMTGTMLYQSDIKLTEMRYWAYSLEPEEVERHAVDIENAGILNPFRIIGNLDPNFKNMEVRRNDTLAMHWNFNSVTTSDASGEFIVQDASSGSSNKRDRLGIFGKYSGYQHTGKGKFFITSSKEAISYEFVNNAKFRHYEQIASSDMINIMNTDDHIFGANQRPTEYHFTIEKSMYDVISQEIINIFAGIVDFNNLIGEPVNRYRDEYKDLSKLRTIFFDKVGTTPDINRYLDFYKWFDDALSLVIRQLVPATAEISDDLYNVVEEHALERNKYKTPFPTMEFKDQIPETFIRGIEELEYSWKFGHSPLPGSNRPQYQKGLYWKSRAEKGSGPSATVAELSIRSASLGPFITSAAGSKYTNSFAIDIGREELRDIIHSNPHFSQSLPTLSKVDGTTYSGNAHAIRTFAKTYKFRVSSPVESVFKGGVNFSPGKSMEKAYNAVAPHGPIEAHGSIGGVGCENCKLPVNILFARSEDFVPYNDLYDPLSPHAKIKMKMKVAHGRDSNKEMLGYATAKSAFFFPMNIISGTVNPDMLINTDGVEVDRKTGRRHLETPNNAYEKRISGSITNIHNDVYGPHMEKPMQGPFTEHYVGGHQSRHVSLNTGSWTSGYSHQLNRPEAWRIYIGRCGTPGSMPDGATAVGIVGPDYPPPDLKLSLTGDHQVSDVYPYIKFPRAEYYRDGTAKRPVNIGNIHHTTGSPTILGNFNHRYDYVQTAGRASQKRYLKDTFEHNYGDRPPGVFGSSSIETVHHHTSSLLPLRFLRENPKSGYTSAPTTASAHFFDVTNIHTLISVSTGSKDHSIGPGGFGNVFGGMEQSRAGGPIENTSNRYAGQTSDYDGTIFIVPKRRRRDGIFTTRFSAPGGPEIMSPGYLDIHTGEFSVYNSLNFRNYTVRSSGSGETIGQGIVFSDNVADKTTGFKSIRMHNQMNTGSEDERLQIRQGLRTLLTRHAGHGYADSQYGYVPESRYIDEDDKAPASYHKIYRNRRKHLRERNTDIEFIANTHRGTEYTHGDDRGAPGGGRTIITASNYDNYWVQHVIPRSDLNYSWITASILHDVGSGLDHILHPSVDDHYGYLPHYTVGEWQWLGYHYSGFLSSSTYEILSSDPKPGKHNAEGPWGSGSAWKIPYNFISASDYVVYHETGSTNPLVLGADKSTIPANTLNHIPIDFVGLNTVIYENITSSTAQLGFHLDHLTSSDGRGPSAAYLGLPQHPAYINDSMIDIATFSTPHGRYNARPLLNMLTLHRQGPYGWPSWKQTRGTSHPIMRYERERNILRAPWDAIEAHFGLDPQNRYYIQPVTSKYKPIQADIAHPGAPGIERTPDEYWKRSKEPYARFYSTNYNQIVALQSDRRDMLFFMAPPRFVHNTWWDSLASTLAEDWASRNPATRPPGHPAQGAFLYKTFYRETVWPSSLMTYMSSSRGRVGPVGDDGVHSTYEERRWRSTHADRVTLGESLNNYKDNNIHVPYHNRRYSYTSGSRLTQSSWPLDAQQDFLTRQGDATGWGTTGSTSLSGSTIAGDRGVIRGSPGTVNGPPRVIFQRHLVAVSGSGNTGSFGGPGAGPGLTGYNEAMGISATGVPLGHLDHMNGYGFISGGYHRGEGELQNGYTMFHGGPTALSGTAVAGGYWSNHLGYPMILQISPTALYARKQTLSSYRSVVGPHGIEVPETASNKLVADAFSSSAGWTGSMQPTTGSPYALYTGSVGRTCWGNIDLFGGEAKWQAPELAGYVSRSFTVTDEGYFDPITMTTVGFEFSIDKTWISASSEPWYTSYEDYILDGRAVAKEYSIVPEYNSSRWIPASASEAVPAPFIRPFYGGQPYYNFIEINLGHTSSWSEAIKRHDEEVVFKVSRGDNLKDLLGVQESLNSTNWGEAAWSWPSRLKLKLDAFVKFIPYEGFYPAQRTLQLADQFWKSHGQQVQVHPGRGFPPGPGFPGSVPETFAMGGAGYANRLTFGTGDPTISPFGATCNPIGGQIIRHPYVVDFNGGISPSYKDLSSAWQAHFTPSGRSIQSGSQGWTYHTGSESMLQGKQLARPLAQTLFAPGILYNSIKSGLAVDYPICVSESFERVCVASHEYAGTFNPTDTTTVGGFPRHGADGDKIGIVPTDYWVISGSRKANTDPTHGRFDYRVPFEAIINPAFAGGAFDARPVIDMEPHPSAALPHTYAELIPAFDGKPSIYSQKASNFFAGVADFYLKDKKYTVLQSDVITTVPVTSGNIYAMRLKLYRSMNLPRKYNGNPKARNVIWDREGDGTYNPHVHNGIHWGGLGVTSSVTKLEYPIPQDPAPSGTFPGYIHWNPAVENTKFECGWPGASELKETFTMYSRPTAFGPPLVGRFLGPLSRSCDHPNAGGGTADAMTIMSRATSSFSKGTQWHWQSEGSGTMDSINGYNWAYTPPYYHGEAWMDIVYKPTASEEVNIEQIFNSPRTYVKHWRVDPGPTGSIAHRGGANQDTHMIVYDPLPPSASINDSGQFYAGNNINFNAMQISASINVFNIERPHENRIWDVSDLGVLYATDPSPMGTGLGGLQSWVIQPKFETPMLNFNDQYNIRALHAPRNNTERLADSGYIDIPIYASESVPRGMWHQFGTIPQEEDQGIFMSVESIPESWLKSHPDVIQHEPTIYNSHYPGDDRPQLGAARYRSLAELIKMPETPVRLGEMPWSKEVSECIVAIPYYIDEVGNKRHFKLKISQQQLNEYRIKRHYAGWKNISDTAFTVVNPESGHTITNTGLTYLFDKMERFVFPPHLDFLRYPENVYKATEELIPTGPDPEDAVFSVYGPRVMYAFEIKHTFDQDDLSYMWQNLAPRNFKSYRKVTEEISHDLLSRVSMPGGGTNNTFLSRQDFIEFGDKMRWMVFKVKQRGTQSYMDVLQGNKNFRELADPAVQGANTEIVFGPATADGTEFPPIPPDWTDTGAGNLLPDHAYIVEHNWPYDYFSLVESAKLTVDIEFRPLRTFEDGSSSEVYRHHAPYGNTSIEIKYPEMWEPRISYSPSPGEFTGPDEYMGPDDGGAPTVTDSGAGFTSPTGMTWAMLDGSPGIIEASMLVLGDDDDD